MLLDAYLHQAYARELRNLQLQERRLRSHREKDIAELREIQKECRKRREEQLEAARMYERYEENHWKFNPAEFGFEFSIEEIEEKAVRLIATRPHPSTSAVPAEAMLANGHRGV